ncbi:hypothetical protein JXM67_12855 [candidate division WOR-3 bacterium]|nr:hypothetical protein [candidate division WOR-3 bacterium]
MANLLWLKPTAGGNLPPTSIFLATRRAINALFVLGSFNPVLRPKAYERLVTLLYERFKTLGLNDVRVEHSLESGRILGQDLPIYVALRRPKDLLTTTTFSEILAEQQMLHEDLEREDVFKLLYQAINGVQHILTDTEAAWKLLCEEWDSLEIENDEPFAERISPEGDLYRVNLRPAKELALDMSRLFEAMKRSTLLLSAGFEQRKTRLLAAVSSIGVEADEVPEQPLRHSESYKTRVRPAYRLLHASEIAGLLTPSGK